jgi:hypothetical protein
MYHKKENWDKPDVLKIMDMLVYRFTVETPNQAMREKWEKNRNQKELELG